jgi:regulator of sigma E protease
MIVLLLAAYSPPAHGFLNYLFIVAYISIALAFFNLLPIPAVDGSYILFFLFELISRRKLNYNVLRIIQNVGLGLIILLGVLVIFNDIWSLSNGQASFQQTKSLIETLMI